MRARLSITFLFAALIAVPVPPAAASLVLTPPVHGPVIVTFEEPDHRYAPGHRGIDISVASGTRVAAAAAGVVTFAGTAGTTNAVAIAHPGGFETTYSHLQTIEVEVGRQVEEGSWIGTTGAAHPGGLDGLHFGVKKDDRYVDPELMMGSFDVSAAIHLAPLVWQPPAEMPDAFRSAFADAGTHEAPCREAQPLIGLPPVPPNDNVAVAIAGITSSTRRVLNADIYEHGPEELGYQEGNIYRFSYRGIDGSELHRPYRSADTFVDIETSAEGLAELLSEIRVRHPGAEVDLLAHSMGGLVARSYLASAAKEQRSDLPRVEHLVTFATPHQGASLAEIAPALEERTLTGRYILDGASLWAQRGGPLPDPHSAAAAQLRPGSDLIGELASESVVFGTRSLTLSIPNDAVVTADKASWPEATASKVVPPAGLQGHSAIVSSDPAQGAAYSFLRGATAACDDAWDLWGPRVGRAVGIAEEQSYRLLAAAEQATITKFLRVGQGIDRVTGGRAKGWAKTALTKGIGKLAHVVGTRAARPNSR